MKNTDKIRLEKAAHILKSIAHPTRLGVVEMLASEKELSVNAMSDTLGCEQSLLSHHLTNMKLKGIVNARRVGTTIYYSMSDINLRPIIECLKEC